MLGAVEDGKVRLIAGITKALSKKVKAGDLVNHVAKQVGGKGWRSAGYGPGRRRSARESRGGTG